MKHKFRDIVYSRKYILLFVFLAAIITSQRFLNKQTSGLKGSVSSDGTGYYFYLPATFIYQDFTYSFIVDKKNNINPNFKPYLNPYINNRLVNKYYCGTALCIAPFFICGMGISSIFGLPMNGYTDLFLMLVSIGGVVYFLLSVYLLIEIAKFFLIPEKLSFVLVLFFFLGTNLFHYVVQEPSMSHVYSFFAISLFFYCLTKLINTQCNKWLVFLGLSLGLIALIRPPNVIVVLFIPFFFNTYKDFLEVSKKFLFTKKGAFMLSFLCFVATLSLQCVYYYLQTGDFWVMSYPGETFDFEDPEIVNILFSYRKGLFVYTPMVFFALLFILISRNEWYKKTQLFVTLGVFLFITASWWCWTYGGGLGNRPFVDIYPLILISALYFLNRKNRNTKLLILSLFLPLVFYNQVIAYQYSHRLLNSIGNVSKEDFWDMFLKTNLQSINDKKIKKVQSANPPLERLIESFENTVADEHIVSPGYKSKHSNQLNGQNNFSKTLVVPIGKTGTKDSFTVIAECVAKANPKGNKLVLVIVTTVNGKITKWESTYFDQFDTLASGWAYMNNVQRFNRYEVNDGTEIKVFAYTTQGSCLVDNLRCSVY